MKLKSTTKSIGLRASLVLGTILLGTGVCSASPITYNINQTIGGGSVVGTIQTDGATGVLGGGDITAWNLALNGIAATFNLTDVNSVVVLVGNDLTATTTDLFFNFSGADNGYLLFQQTLYSGMHYYCDAASLNVCFQGATVTPQSIFDPSAQNVPVSGNQIIGTVGSAVPEPASIALLGVGLAGIAALRRRKSA